MAIYEPGTGPSPDTESADILIIDLASRTVRSEYLVSPHLWYLVRENEQNKTLSTQKKKIGSQEKKIRIREPVTIK